MHSNTLATTQIILTLWQTRKCKNLVSLISEKHKTQNKKDLKEKKINIEKY